jgi:hypothetical protein
MNKPFMSKESDLSCSYFIKTIIILLCAPITLLILSGSLLLTENTFINAIAYAQQQQPDNTTTAANNIGVKITSPTKGQQVPIGILKVEGTSTAGQNLDKELHTDCKVSVILNDIKPYQPVIPTGSGGQNNYSSWSYMLTPNYATIEEGVNKITSKLSCDNDSIAKWYSVNVTGIAGGQEGQEKGQQLSNPIPLPTASSEQNLQSEGAKSSDALTDSDIDDEEHDTFFGKDLFFKDEK